MFVLGIDPSISNTGWAKLWMPPNEPLRLVDTGTISTSSDQMNTVRYLTHRSELEDQMADRRVDTVGIEQPPPNESYSAGLYPIYMYAKAWAFYYRHDVAYFTPTVLKADVRRMVGIEGRRNPDKDEMIDAALNLCEGDHNINDHVADAIHAAYKAGRLYQLVYGAITDDDLTDREEYSFLKIVNHRDGTKTRKGAIYKEGDDRHSTYTRFSSPKYDFLY